MKIQLKDLPDECLLEVLDRLSPNQLMKMRLNRRLDRLASEQIRFKTKAIAFDRTKPNNYNFIIPIIGFNESNSLFFDCAHLKINSNQVLVLKSKFIYKFGRSLLWKEKQLFLTIMTRCPNVKSIDFDDFEIPDRLLIKVFQRCPKIDCIKLSPSLSLANNYWTESLSRFGRRISGKNSNADDTNDVDVALQNLNIKEKSPKIRLLKLIVKLCPNIKHIDLYFDGPLKRDFLKTVKLLPDNCWLGIHCTTLGKGYEDVVDELDVRDLSFSKLRGRVERLSSLKLNELLPSWSSVDVEFAGLKKLDFRGLYFKRYLDCLFASRFPLLEELCFSANIDFTDDDYDKLFQKMPSVKKLIIDYFYPKNESHPCLPTASIHQLNNLETIDFQIFRVRREWKPKEIIQKLEQYINVISFKKLTLKVYDSCDVLDDEVRKMLVDEVRRLKLMQCQVEVELFIRIKTELISHKIDLILDLLK